VQRFVLSCSNVQKNVKLTDPISISLHSSSDWRKATFLLAYFV